MSTNARPPAKDMGLKQDAKLVAELLRTQRRRESIDRAARNRELLRDAEAGRARRRFARGGAGAHQPVEPMS